jgi:hypothetical protein
MKGVHIVRGHGKEYCYAWRGGPRIMSKMGTIWTDEVALITVDHYPTREDAEAAEAAVILAERPTFNRVVRIAKKLAA